jgi:hypothetical protein
MRGPGVSPLAHAGVAPANIIPKLGSVCTSREYVQRVSHADRSRARAICARAPKTLHAHVPTWRRSPAHAERCCPPCGTIVFDPTAHQYPRTGKSPVVPCRRGDQTSLARKPAVRPAAVRPQAPCACRSIINADAYNHEHRERSLSISARMATCLEQKTFRPGRSWAPTMSCRCPRLASRCPALSPHGCTAWLRPWSSRTPC